MAYGVLPDGKHENRGAGDSVGIVHAMYVVVAWASMPRLYHLVPGLPYLNHRFL